MLERKTYPAETIVVKAIMQANNYLPFVGTGWVNALGIQLVWAWLLQLLPSQLHHRTHLPTLEWQAAETVVGLWCVVSATGLHPKQEDSTKI